MRDESKWYEVKTYNSEGEYQGVSLCCRKCHAWQPYCRCRVVN